MTKMIFVNLPVADLKASMTFYTALGFKNNPQFSDDTAACMVWSEAIHVMLLTHDKWRTFTDRPIPSSTSSEVLIAISLENREAVDTLNTAATANGGTADINPARDMGFMYNVILPTRTGMCGKRFGWTRRRFPLDDLPG